MIQPVGEYLTMAAHQSGDNGQIGHITGGKQQGGRQADKAGKAVFKLMMRDVMTTDQMRRASAYPHVRQGLRYCCRQLRMIRQTQVIITAKRQQLAPIQFDLNPLRAFQQTTLAEQVLPGQTIQFGT